MVSSGTARRNIRRLGRALLGLVVVLLALAVVGAIYQAIATERAERAYPPPGEMVDVGGHRLHIDCAGQGSPTVVLDAGSGEMSADWALVQRGVSGTTRVCAYDRAGMGWSETGPEPRDAEQISGELRTLLTEAGIEGPYVLAGHSFGGLYALTYAAHFPEEVAGVCLVDSSSPEQFGHRPAAQGGPEPPTRISAVASLLARIGAVRLFYKVAPAPPDLPNEQRAQIDALGPSTQQWSTTTLEFRVGLQTATQARGLRSLGDKPLAVVSAGTQEPEWLDMQGGLAALSPDSTHRVVEGATHASLLYDEGDSQATSATIVEVVQAVRNDRPLAH